MNITLTKGTQRLITLSPNGPLVGPPNWSRLSGTCPVDISDDGLSANVAPISSSDVGRTILAITAQSGESIIGDVIGINVVAEEATSLSPA